MQKINVITLGCAKNRVDSEHIAAQLAEVGYEIVFDSDRTDAKVVVINTCGFIGDAKQESIDTILDAVAAKDAGYIDRIFVIGCLSERYADELRAEIPEVDDYFGARDLSGVVKALGAEYNSNSTARELSTPKHYAYLKIAEGCDNHCTYCAIPMLRGKFRSRPIEEIVEEAKELERMGIKELNLIAQDTSRYGLDLYGDYALAKLVKAVTKATNIPWIRLLYCYPDKITDELLEEYKTNPRLVKYIDLPIQHINDRILKAMNRHGDGALIRETVARIRKAVPDMAIRTTAIVGFPGETEEEFNELCEFIKETKFTHFGAFPYSAEEDTPAALLPDQIDEQVKQDRYDIIMNTQIPNVEAYNRSMLEKRVKVVVEGFDPLSETFYGRSAADAPDIDRKIYFTAAPGQQLKLGSFVFVRIKEVVDYDLLGIKI